MLVLTRQIGEELLIAGNIWVTVVAVKGNQVRLGITAPPSVPVVRRELLAECQVGSLPALTLRAGPDGMVEGSRPGVLE